MSAPPWLTKESVAEFAKLKMDHPDGLDVFTAMAVAAHKQWEDIEFMISVGPKPGLGSAPSMSDEDINKYDKIRTRHEAYRTAKEGRTDVIFP